MELNFDKTKRMQENVSGAVDAMNAIVQWLEVVPIQYVCTKKYVLNFELLAKSSLPLDDYLMAVNWRLFPFSFRLGKEDQDTLSWVLERYNETQREMIVDVLREHNPTIIDIENEFLQNLQSLSTEARKELIAIYRAKWNGHIPEIEDKEKLLASIDKALNKAERKKTIDDWTGKKIHLQCNEILERLDSLGNEISAFLANYDPEQADDMEEGEPKNGQLGMKVATDVLVALLNKANISISNADKTKIAEFISYITGYSKERIRKRLTYPDDLRSQHEDEVEKINATLKGLNAEISIKCYKYR